MSPYLWQTEQQRQPPGQHYDAVAALSGPTAVGLQGAADGKVAVYRHGYNYVGGGKHPKHLQVFHQATQEVRTREAAFSIPHQLGQDLSREKEGGQEVGGGSSCVLGVCARVLPGTVPPPGQPHRG